MVSDYREFGGSLVRIGSTILKLNRHCLVRAFHEKSSTVSALERGSTLEVWNSAWSSPQAGQTGCELT